MPVDQKSTEFGCWIR